ncbi:hypothetical protein TCAL_05861, partial [Tigriopus californicus]
SVECPVCYNVPRVAPVPCCSNGHVICQRCKAKLENCPTCRVRLTDCVSQIAATIIHRVSHTCEFRYEGCTFKSDIDKITDHESSCIFRHVRCPHWACDETITAKNLTHHVIASECGDNYRDKPLPYREEMEYARALDDEEGNGFWRPSLIQFDGITFYLQVEKSGKTKNWYFYVQMEGSALDCKMYGVTIKVRKSLVSEGHSVVYNGDVCPIDIKGVGEVENSGGGLNIRNSIMENIFDVDALDRSDLEQQEESGGDVEAHHPGEQDLMRLSRRHKFAYHAIDDIGRRKEVAQNLRKNGAQQTGLRCSSPSNAIKEDRHLLHGLHESLRVLDAARRRFDRYVGACGAVHADQEQLNSGDGNGRVRFGQEIRGQLHDLIQSAMVEYSRYDHAL